METPLVKWRRSCSSAAHWRPMENRARNIVQSVACVLSKWWQSFGLACAVLVWITTRMRRKPAAGLFIREIVAWCGVSIKTAPHINIKKNDSTNEPLVLSSFVRCQSVAVTLLFFLCASAASISLDERVVIGRRRQWPWPGRAPLAEGLARSRPTVCTARLGAWPRPTIYCQS